MYTWYGKYYESLSNSIRTRSNVCKSYVILTLINDWLLLSAFLPEWKWIILVSGKYYERPGPILPKWICKYPELSNSSNAFKELLRQSPKINVCLVWFHATKMFIGPYFYEYITPKGPTVTGEKHKDNAGENHFPVKVLRHIALWVYCSWCDRNSQQKQSIVAAFKMHGYLSSLILFRETFRYGVT